MIRINVLPDDVLLEIFDFYMKERFHHGTKAEVETWHSLVHVCRRWRHVVFGSPHRLNLQLVCTPGTPARDTLDVWPALPLLIRGMISSTSSVDDIVVALGHSNRVCEVHLLETGRRQLEEISAAMQMPFPEMTNLFLHCEDETPPVIPDSFLGGSAPRLRVFELSGIPCLGLPQLLLSATHLVHLVLYHIPHSGYFSPQAMAALLSVLSSLEKLSLGFESPRSRPDLESRRPPPLKHSVIPSLTHFVFKGVSEYLEDLVTSIDAPQLHYLDIIFFNQIDFDTPRLAQFIDRTPTFGARDEAHVQFDGSVVNVKLTYRTHGFGYAASRIGVSCREPDWQLSSIEQICNFSLPPLSMVEDLYIDPRPFMLRGWKSYAVENTLWLDLLLPFTAVKNLYLDGAFVSGIEAALQELGGARITEILPSLRNIFVRGVRGSLGEFIAARQHSGHPVAISVWDEELPPIGTPAPVPSVTDTD